MMFILYVVVVSPGDEQLKVTLAWDDVPGSPNVIPSLVNDLDLRVYSPSSVQYFPLDPWTPPARKRPLNKTGKIT